MRHAIRRQLPNVIALIAIVIVALAVGGYILANARLTLPGWFPVIGHSVYTLKAEFQTAQAVTPGQGQTVDIAGVEVGSIKSVELHDGRALVTMELNPEFKGKVFPDATILMRPKTGLKDMVLQLDPGSGQPSSALEEGATIPVQNTQPDVDLDQILASLDTDSREYLKLLLSGGGTALRKGGGRELANTFRRFDPTARNLDKINSLLSTRRRDLRRVIHNFGELADAVAGKDRQLASLIESSNSVFRAFARQDNNLRDAISQLPATLDEAQTALAKGSTLADQLGPTAQALDPGARALGPALAATHPFLRDTTPVLRDQLRPFARKAQPVVRELRPAANSLVKATPDLRTTLKQANTLLNMLAYNPPGQQEGYLFYNAWAGHNGNSIFSTSDGNGPIRRGALIADCITLQTLGALQILPGAVGGAGATLGAFNNLPSGTADTCSP